MIYARNRPEKTATYNSVSFMPMENQRAIGVIRKAVHELRMATGTYEPSPPPANKYIATMDKAQKTDISIKRSCHGKHPLLISLHEIIC